MSTDRMTPTPTAAASAEQRENEAAFQDRVQPWMMACFGAEISGDREERNHRFLEEALELVQSKGCSASEAHQLVDYVFSRPMGIDIQEVGGVMVTLAALCLANHLDMHRAGEIELARIWTCVEKIRAKQAAKPRHSPLPIARRATTPAPQREDRYQAGLLRAAEMLTARDLEMQAIYDRTPSGTLKHDAFVRGHEAGQMASAIRAEAAAPNLTAPRVVEQGEADAWQWRYADEPEMAWVTKACKPNEVPEDGSNPIVIRPLYAAPPAPVLAGEVTELLEDLYRFLHAEWEGFGCDEQEGTQAAEAKRMRDRVHEALHPIYADQRAALTAARPRADAGVTEVWQPIASAPKDGTAVLLIDGDTDCPVVARWVGNCWRVCWDNEIYDLSNLGGRGCHWMRISDRAAREPRP